MSVSEQIWFPECYVYIFYMFMFEYITGFMCIWLYFVVYLCGSQWFRSKGDSNPGHNYLIYTIISFV